MRFPALSRESQQEQIYRALCEKIVAGEFEPGQTLSIADVAKAFGVSATPAREALLRMVADGVLDSAPMRASAVPVLTPAKFDEIALIRVELEGLATQLAASRASAADIDTLAALEARTRRAAAVRDVRAYLACNQAFHFAVYGLSGADDLVEIIRKLWLRVGPTLRLFGTEGIGDHGDQHDVIIDALRRGDPRGARRLMVADIRDGVDFVRAKMKGVARARPARPSRG